MEQEPMKVSDWSQPIKIGLMLGFLVSFAIVAGIIIYYLHQIAINTMK